MGAVTSVSEYSLGAGDVYRGNDLSTHFLPSQVTLFNCEADCIQVNATGDASDAFVHYQYTRTPYETVVTQSDPGKIIAAGAMNIAAGTLFNDRSQILAGGALSVTATDVQNTTVEGERRFKYSGTATSSWRHRHSGRDSSDISVGDYAAGNFRRVRTCTLNSLAESRALPPPNFMKLDVQGAELEILAGASALLNQCHAVYMECPVVEYNEGAPSFDAYVTFMAVIGYSPLQIFEQHVVAGVLTQVDVLFIRNSTNEKLSAAKGVHFHFGRNSNSVNPPETNSSPLGPETLHRFR